MNTKLFTLAIACAATLVAQAQNVYFQCDFEHGIPDSFRLYDRDGLEPSQDMKKLGFEVGTAWLDTPVSDGNRVACSISWYKSAGTSDDWMVTPCIHVSSENAILSWVACAHDGEFADGYSVYISSTGNECECFDTSAPLFSTGAEGAEWVKHSVSLDDYAGRDIYLAFVNNSTDCSRLYIDDIYVGLPSNVYLLSSVPDVVGVAGEYPVSGKLYTDNDTPVKGVRIGLNQDGVTSWEEFPDMVISKGERVEFTLSTPLKTRSNETVDYSLTVDDGESSYDISRQVTALQTRALCEELTGTWCSYCVRGIAMLEQMKSLYGETFIPVAVHRQDVMAINEYDRLYSFVSTGLPFVVLNRSATTSGDPLSVESYYRTVMASAPQAGIESTADYDSQTGSIRVCSNLMFAHAGSKDDYRLCYVVRENEVCHPGDPEYTQQNAYAGGSPGSMFGWESKPSVITDMVFQEVARALPATYEGTSVPLPDEIPALTPIEVRYSFELPDNVDSAKNTEVVAMILDKGGKVVNSSVAPLRDPASLEGPGRDGAGTVTAYGAGVRLSLSRISEVRVYDQNGFMRFSGKPKAGTHDIALDKGLYIVLVDGRAFKVAVR